MFTFDTSGMCKCIKKKKKKTVITNTAIRCSVQCLANFKVSPSNLGIIVNTPNIVFGQEWDLPEETSGESNVDNESDDEETAIVIVGTFECRMGARDLTYVYPSHRTISRYLEDASYMNRLMVAEEW